MRLHNLLVGSLATWLTVGLARAQEAAEAVAVSAEPSSMTIRQIIDTGGWLMYVLAAMSVVGLTLIIYFLVALRRDQIIPQSLVDQVRGLLRAGKSDEALTVCRDNESAFSNIVGAALEYALAAPKTDPGLLREIVEGEGGRQATMLQNQTQYLMDIGVIAPMIGLLGTVMGMLKAFNAVALDLAKAKPMLLAGGVSQALITTVAGLIVAIPAMIAYAYFRGRTSRLISDLEKNSAEMTALMYKE